VLGYQHSDQQQVHNVERYAGDKGKTTAATYCPDETNVTVEPHRRSHHCVT
jgi:hypothetical protein